MTLDLETCDVYNYCSWGETLFFLLVKLTYKIWQISFGLFIKQ